MCLWGRDGCVGGKECGGGWRLGAPPLECESAVTAVDFAPRKTSDNRSASGGERGLVPVLLKQLSSFGGFIQYT